MKINRLKEEVLAEKVFIHRQQARQAFFTHYNYDLAVRVAFEKHKDRIENINIPSKAKCIALQFPFDGMICTALYDLSIGKFTGVMTPTSIIEL